jgi:hypothetical protein
VSETVLTAQVPASASECGNRHSNGAEPSTQRCNFQCVDV